MGCGCGGAKKAAAARVAAARAAKAPAPKQDARMYWNGPAKKKTKG